MGIDFKRRLRFLMPCKILNGLYIDAPQKQVGDVGMSQNVGRYIEVEAVGVSATLCLCSQFGFHLERRLFPIGITVVYPLFSSPPFDISPHTPKLCFGQGISVRCMDYKVRGTVRLLSLQAIGELVGNWNRPSGRFGLQAIRNHRLAVLESGSSPHINMRRFVQMHAVPLQTKNLFGAKAGVQPDHAEQVRRAVFDGAHKDIYDGVVFTDGYTQVTYYNQLDDRWKNSAYGTDHIGGYACGPTAMAIVVSSLTSETIDPPHMSQWAYENGYWCSKSGSYHTLIPGAAEEWRLNCEGCTASEPQRIVDALSEGKLVVALMSKGHFTSSGHFIVLRGVTSDGKILVADPSSYNRSEKEWDLSIILNEASRRASAGGPFWIIGNE